MRIKSVEINNFRSIRQLEAKDISLVTPVCGANGAGKSNFLRAIRFALVSDFSPQKMQANVNNQLSSANAAAKVSLRFDEPTRQIAKNFGLPPKEPFTFTVSVKRNGRSRAYLSGDDITQEQRRRFVGYFYIINVPPVRDIEADGLKPLRRVLIESLRKTKGPNSFQNRLGRLTNYISSRGDTLLENAKAYLNDWPSLEGFSVDVDSIDFQKPLENTEFHAVVNGHPISVDKLGTGYQSSLVIQSYIQLASGVDEFVLFFFEEPDNHLHPASMKAMADELKSCGIQGDSQVFFTTHSPHLINQFNPNQPIAVRDEGPDVGTCLLVGELDVSSRKVQVTLTKHGMLPSEALLARRVIITEGPLDAQIVNKMVELEYGISPDRQDILVLSGGGKVGAAEIFVLLKKLGVDALVIFDWDALRNDKVPYFKSNPPTSRAELTDFLDRIEESLFLAKKSKAPKHLKTLRSMKRELESPIEYSPGYSGCVVEGILSELASMCGDDVSSLPLYSVQNRVDNARRCLNELGIWVWKVDPEHTFIRNETTANNILALLEEHGFIHQAPSDDTKIGFLRNWIKKLASDAERFDQFFDALWEESLLNHTEYRKLAKRICDFSPTS